MNFEQLLLSVYRALLFNILHSIRFIFIQAKERNIILYIYSDIELTHEEKDIYYAVLGEISGDFPIIKDDLNEVFFMVNNKPFEQIINKGYLVYARFENI